MIQIFRNYARATLAAKVISFTTDQDVTIESGAEYGQKWLINAEVSYEAALLVLRFDLAKPEDAPSWWSEAEKDWHEVFSDPEVLFHVTSGENVFYERADGLSPSRTLCANSYFVDLARELYDRLYAPADKAEKQLKEQQDSDPNYQEDLRNARHADFLDELADASDSPEEYQRLIQDWSDFTNNKN